MLKNKIVIASGPEMERSSERLPEGDSNHFV